MTPTGRVRPAQPRHDHPCHVGRPGHRRPHRPRRRTRPAGHRGRRRQAGPLPRRSRVRHRPRPDRHLDRRGHRRQDHLPGPTQGTDRTPPDDRGRDRHARGRSREHLTVLRDADPDDKTAIFRQLGLRLTYQPGSRTVLAEANSPAIMYRTECPRGIRHLNPAHSRGTSVHSLESTCRTRNPSTRPVGVDQGSGNASISTGSQRPPSVSERSAGPPLRGLQNTQTALSLLAVGAGCRGSSTTEALREHGDELPTMPRSGQPA